MGIFDEKGVDVIDYTLLKKKGILKVPEIPKRDFGITNDEFVDLSNKKAVQAGPVFSSNTGSSASNSSSITATPSFANFFGDSSSASEGTNTVQTYYEADSSTNSNSRPIGAEADLSALKIKIEDVEYKLDRLIERLDKLESTNK